MLHDMFVPYGDLREVYVIRGYEGSSKGCAFVKFVDREAAINAIEDMNNRIPIGSTRPLVIKFADVKKHGKKIDSDDDISERMNGMSINNSHQYLHQQYQQYSQYPPYLNGYGYSHQNVPLSYQSYNQNDRMVSTQQQHYMANSYPVYSNHIPHQFQYSPNNGIRAVPGLRHQQHAAMRSIRLPQRDFEQGIDTTADNGAQQQTNVSTYEEDELQMANRPPEGIVYNLFFYLYYMTMNRT